jgi:rfaE bifunctional protein nucleotidyltransferase chain/domain
MQFLLKDNIQIINTIKAERKKIVFTNGCFDLLHVGHIRYLAQAKKLGDFLIIGLNSDSSVKELKGEDRPINSFEDRATLLSAIE